MTTSPAAEWWAGGGCVQSAALDKGMTHVPGGTEREGLRFHYATQNSSKLKTYELFVSGIFHVIFSDHG